jgi:AcrR family transcriptional regulator
MITNSDHPDKASQIIDVAQKRFGMYGLEKTSMREIAEDLNLTKGSLYYYFPDKEHLYAAVIEKEQEQFIRHLEESVSTITVPDEILMKYVEARINYFKVLLNLSRLRLETFKGLKPILQDKWTHFNEREVKLISIILNRGSEQGRFHIENVEETARLYLAILRGLRQSVLSHKQMMFIDEGEYDSLVQVAKSFTELFIRGIKYSK